MVAYRGHRIQVSVWGLSNIDHHLRSVMKLYYEQVRRQSQVSKSRAARCWRCVNPEPLTSKGGHLEDTLQCVRLPTNEGP